MCNKLLLTNNCFLKSSRFVLVGGVVQRKRELTVQVARKKHSI